MTALYLHNALFNSQNTPSPPIAHHVPSSRGIHRERSLMSLQTISSRNSDPVQQTLLASVLHHDLPDHRSLGIEDECLPMLTRKRLNRLQLWKWTLLVLIFKYLTSLHNQPGLDFSLGVWAVYNTVRYFVSSPKFITRDRRSFAFLLGASTSLSLALVAATILVNFLTGPTVPRYEAVWTTTEFVKRIVLPYSASWFVLVPSIVNFILVFVWKRSTEPENSLVGRCTWEIDVVWSGRGMRCTSSSPPWFTWFIGAMLRLFLTFGFLIAYHAIHYHSEKFQRLAAHTRLHSDQSTDMRGEAHGQLDTHSNVMDNPSNIRRHDQHHKSSSIRSYHHKPVGAGSGGVSIRESTSSGKNPPPLSVETDIVLESRPSRNRPSQGSRAPLPSALDLFHGIASKPTQDTQNSVHLAKANRHKASSSEQYLEPSIWVGEDDGMDQDQDDFDAESPIEFRPLSNQDRSWFYYDTSGRPALADPKFDDDRVEVLGGLVHRMPTIESVKSRESRSRRTSTGPDGINSPVSRNASISLNTPISPSEISNYSCSAISLKPF